MHGQIAVLLDAPVVEAQATQSLHPVAKLGRYEDPRYGKFQITRADVASWQKNLSGLQGGRIPIDYDHQAEAPTGSTKAAGWITRLELMAGARLGELVPAYAASVDHGGEYAVATIDWTPEGAQSVRDGYWLYVSPTFCSRYTDEQETDHGPALIGTALTNRPFLRRGMPAISLTVAALTDDLPAAHEAPGDEPKEPRDSRATMPEFTDKLAAALGLDAGADEDTILATLAEKTKAPEPPAPKLSLTETAAREGKVVLGADEHAQLAAQAKQGAEAHEQLRKLTFTRAYDAALQAGRLASDDETREKWSGRYEKDPDMTLEVLAELPVIAQVRPSGDGGSRAEAPEGVDEHRFQLHTRAKAIAAEQKIPLVDAAELAEKELTHAA